MNILVVDDNITNRLLLNNMIVGMGHTLDEAENGEESVKLVGENEYDIIFMDMMMPIMNGYEATKIIKKLKPHIPVYIISAYKAYDFPSDWKNADYEDILSKPVSLNLINDIINKHI